MSKHQVTYSGVVISLERDERGEYLVFAYGEVNGKEGYFYIKLKNSELERVLRLGLGQRVEGRGFITSENPLLVHECV